MFNENSLFWIFPQSEGWYLMAVACEAIPNDLFEVELAFYVGKQLGKEIHWIESFGLPSYTLDDIEDLEDIVVHMSTCPTLLSKAEGKLFGILANEMELDPFR